MKFLSEYREAEGAKRLVEAILRESSRPWVIMEVCGGQTHAIVRYGLDELLEGAVELLHGPGCPVCVTPLETIDKAQAIARHENVILCSYGDMLRVPGSHGDLFQLRSEGADVRIVYSPLDAVAIAEKNPEKEVVFLAIGFETTAPANATAAIVAKRQGLQNFSMLASHVLVPPAITSILQTPESRVQAFLGPGHVCSVVGTRQYSPIAQHYKVPIVVSGFEPIDLLEGLLRCVRQLEEGRAEVEIQYGRAVNEEGNPRSIAALAEVFDVVNRKWRGVGIIPKSGYAIRYEYRDFDAERRFSVEEVEAFESPKCISGRVLRGLALPVDCSAFGEECTPENPLGATMVSGEGACAAYFSHGRERLVQMRLPKKTGTNG